MSVSYDVFAGAFLSKIMEYDLMELNAGNNGVIADSIIDGYLKRAVSQFKKNCKYDLFSTGDDESREFGADIKDEDMDELVDIISEGMIVQWLKPYVYQQENLQSVLNTRDFTTYSPAELLRRVGDAHTKAQRNYTQMIREYSYNHGDLTRLHL